MGYWGRDSWKRYSMEGVFGLMRLAVFASGTGSNFEALQSAVDSGDLSASIELVVCDQPGAGVIEKAKRTRIETLVLSPKSFDSKAQYETRILQHLQEKEIELVVLAGYMRLIGPILLENYPSRIVNIHPSLLPNFPGLHAIEKAFEAGVGETGVTIHFVDEGMDTGPILAQQSVLVTQEDTLESLEARIHEVEHKLYPETLQKLIQEAVIN